MLKLLALVISLVALVLTASTVHGQSGDYYEITGRITYHDASPAAGLDEVCVWARAGTTSFGCMQRTNTDSQGHFALTVQAGTYSLMVKFEGSLTYWHARTESVTMESHEMTWFTIPDELPLHLHIALPPTMIISGSILDADGNPTDNITLWLCTYDLWRCTTTTTTDSAGNFAIHTQMGEYFLNLMQPGGTELYYDADATHNLSEGVAEATRIRVRDSDISLDPMRLPELARLEVTLPTDVPLRRWAPVSIGICAQDESWEMPRTCISWRDWTVRHIDGFQPYDVDFPLSAEGEYYVLAQRGDFASRWYYAESEQFVPDPARRALMTASELNGRTIALPTFTQEQDYSLTLDPGWNLVGWVGGLISFDEFCQPHTVTGLYVLHPDWMRRPGDYCLSASTNHDQDGWQVDQSGIQTGDVLLVHVSAAQPQSLHWTTDRLTQLWPTKFDLQAGAQFRVWLGPEATSLDHIERGLGPDASVTNLSAYLAPNRDSRAAADPGDILHLNVSRNTAWLAPNGTAPEMVVSELIANGIAGDPGQGHALKLAENTLAVVEYFWTSLGVAAADIVVRFSPDWEAATGHGLGASGFARRYGLWLEHATTFLIAHEYYHVLQNRLRSQSAPTWLWEGTAVYNGSWAFARATGGAEQEREFATSRESWIRDARRLQTQLSDLQGLDGAYTVGALAAEYLTLHHGGDQAMIHFWRLGSSTATWQIAFEQAFGISAEDFYAAFADYRANGFE